MPLGVIAGHLSSLCDHFRRNFSFFINLKTFIVFEKKRAMKRPKCENVWVFVGPNGGV